MRLVFSALLLATAWTASAQGNYEGIVGHANPSPVVTDVNATVGWTFQPLSWMAVTNLGCFDALFTSNPGIESVQVGLWTDAGSLLASSVITPSSILFNESRYVSIEPVSLDVGQTYHIGAYGLDTLDGFTSVEVCGPAIGGSVSTSTNIALRATAKNSAGFGFPAEGAGTEGLAYLAPNFRWGIPEPSSALLLGLAAVLFAARRR